MSGDDNTLPAKLLHQLLRYEPSTGFLYWRERTPEMFRDSYRKAAGCANNWNSQYANCRALTSIGRKGHCGGTVLDIKVQAHRVIWAMVTGHWPKNDIDHQDGVGSNNRIRNLRDVTNAVNHRNVKLQANNLSGHHGVRFIDNTGRWQARIKLDQRERFLGSFATKAEAVEARRKAERQFGFHPNHGRRPAETLQPALVGAAS